MDAGVSKSYFHQREEDFYDRNIYMQNVVLTNLDIVLL